MSRRDEEDYASNPNANALRAAGYKRCPRWWLTDEQLEIVSYMARQNEPDIKRIRLAAQRNLDPIEKAWREHEQRR